MQEIKTLILSNLTTALSVRKHAHVYIPQSPLCPTKQNSTPSAPPLEEVDKYRHHSCPLRGWQRAALSVQMRLDACGRDSDAQRLCRVTELSPAVCKLRRGTWSQVGEGERGLRTEATQARRLSWWDGSRGWRKGSHLWFLKGDTLLWVSQALLYCTTEEGVPFRGEEETPDKHWSLCPAFTLSIGTSSLAAVFPNWKPLWGMC